MLDVLHCPYSRNCKLEHFSNGVSCFCSQISRAAYPSLRVKLEKERVINNVTNYLVSLILVLHLVLFFYGPDFDHKNNFVKTSGTHNIHDDAWVILFRQDMKIQAEKAKQELMARAHKMAAEELQRLQGKNSWTSSCAQLWIENCLTVHIVIHIYVYKCTIICMYTYIHGKWKSDP